MPLAILAFLVGVSFIPGLPSDATVGRWAVMAIGSAGLLCAIRIRPTPGHWMLAGLLAWIVAGFAWAVSFWDHAGGLWQWIVIAMAFCIGAEAERLDGAVKGLCAAVTISAMVAVAQAAGYSPVWTIYHEHSGFAGLFLSKNMAADVAGLALVGSACLIAADWRRHWWTMPGPLVAAWLVNSRTLWLMLAVAAVAALWLISQTWRRRMVVAGSALIGVYALALLWVAAAKPEWLWDGPMRVLDRVEIWRVALGGMHPLGDGLGSFAIGALGMEFVHSELLQYAFELGAGSVLIWGIVVYALGASPIAERIALVSFLVPAALYFPLHAPASALAFALLAGRLSGARHRAVVAQSDGRADRGRGAGQDAPPLWTGSLCSADLGRLDLSARQKPALGA